MMYRTTAVLRRIGMKKLAVMTVGLVVVLATISAAAQMTPPTPAPELKKLDYFIGTWNIDATIGPGPWGGGGKFTATGTDEWLKGNFFVVGHDDFSLPAEMGGGGTAVTIMSYDPENKVYTYRAFSSMGEAENATGTLDGDTLT
jgi:hypothetical protein